MKIGPIFVFFYEATWDIEW